MTIVTSAGQQRSKQIEIDLLLSSLTPENVAIYSALSAELSESQSSNRIDLLFPDLGPLRRELYQKHLEFFAAGTTERERAFMAANRVGKSYSGGGFETALHLMGDYPPWWPGRRFTHPIAAWAAGDTGETVREIIQPILFGPPGSWGQGLIRAPLIEKLTAKRGSPDAIDGARIRHASGGLSTLLFKSYEQGRKSFQGTKLDFIWLDEEPPVAIYTECLLRTAATTPAGDDWGSVLCTFTPLLGISEVVLHFLGQEGALSSEGRTYESDPVTYSEQPPSKRDLIGDLAKPPVGQPLSPLLSVR